jgi:hypothetical protein
LALCFSFQVWDSWHKFWEGKTSWSVSAVATPLEPLPPFTLPKNVTINDIWEKSSNTPNWIRVGNDQITLDGIHFNTTRDEISKVEQINSLFLGKCLSMVPRKKRNSTDYLTLTVCFPPNRLPDQVILFLGTRYSLVPGDFISPSTKTIYIQPGYFGTLKIDRNFDIHKKHGQCKDYDLDDSVEKCYITDFKIIFYITTLKDGKTRFLGPFHWTHIISQAAVCTCFNLGTPTNLFMKFYSKLIIYK